MNSNNDMCCVSVKSNNRWWEFYFVRYFMLAQLIRQGNGVGLPKIYKKTRNFIFKKVMHNKINVVLWGGSEESIPPWAGEKESNTDAYKD
ncbi:MAG: hypothetical protein Q9N32_00460 [Gammaproteobacteria bacterium]|nr:hypothetical protein [Gammaproteobacteria bacterium]